jgi:hypothetical protein
VYNAWKNCEEASFLVDFQARSSFLLFLRSPKLQCPLAIIFKKLTRWRTILIENSIEYRQEHLPNEEDYGSVDVQVDKDIRDYETITGKKV